MNEQERKLWQKIVEFNIDDPSSSFTFTDRLCRENNWTMEYSLRAVQEYKKFIYLVCISNQPQTPSDQVDQVWHLHLLYTHSYWKELCGEILKKEIHHGPTKGSEEKTKFKDLYSQTLDLYTHTFNTKPPTDIWPAPSQRMAEIKFTRVNRHRFWLIPKLKMNK